MRGERAYFWGKSNIVAAEITNQNAQRPFFNTEIELNMHRAGLINN